MTRSALHKLKGAGYLTSAVSVVLLSIVSWSHMKDSFALSVCLLGGAATSVIGMFCRWLTYEIGERQAKPH